MNENKVMRQSLYVFLVGCALFSLVGLIFSDISYVIGFILGYIINMIVFLLIIKMSTEILKLSTASLLIAFGFVIKLLLYALGFFIAVRTQYVHIIGVFFGYLVTKITIYIGGYIYKGGESRG